MLTGSVAAVTGSTSGIGLAIVKRAAADGANVAIAAKTVEPNPKLPGTIHSAAEEIEAVGGKALALACDIRDEEQVAAAVKKTADKFGGIDILINNAAPSFDTTPPEATPRTLRFDVRGHHGGLRMTQAACDEAIGGAQPTRTSRCRLQLNMNRVGSARGCFPMAKYG